MLTCRKVICLVVASYALIGVDLSVIVNICAFLYEQKFVFSYKKALHIHGFITQASEKLIGLFIPLNFLY